MKKPILLQIAVFALIGALGVAFADEPQGEMRTWTDRNGNTLDAVFQRADFGIAHFQTAEGRAIAVRITELSPDDQAVVRNLMNPNATLTTAASSQRRGLLTDQQIAQFKTEHPGRSSDETLTFQASFYPRGRLSEADRRRYSRMERIPFRITSDLLALRQRNNRMERTRQRGTVNFFIMNEKGEVVDRGTRRVEQMCPT